MKDKPTYEELEQRVAELESEVKKYHSYAKILRKSGFFTDDIFSLYSLNNALNEMDKFQRMFEDSSLGIFYSTYEGRMLAVNKAFAQMFGYASPNELVNCVNDIENQLYVDPERRKEIIRGLEKKDKINFINQYYKKDKTTFYGKMFLRKVFDKVRNTFILEGYVDDITIETEYRNKLKLANDRLNGFIDNSLDGMAIIDNEGEVVKWNQAIEKITDISEKAAMGQKIWNIQFKLVPKDRRTPIFFDSVKNIVIEALETGKTPHNKKYHQTTIETINKSKKIIEELSFSINTEKGYYLGIIFRDISKEKEIEEKARENERRLSTLISNIKGVAYRSKFNPERSMQYLSNGFYDLTGYAPKDFNDERTFNFSDLIYPGDNCWENIEKTIIQNKSFECIYRIITKKSEIRWVQEKGMAVYDDAKNIVSIEGLLTDVTELKTKEIELYELKELQKSTLESMHDIVMVLDQSNNFVLVHALKNKYDFFQRENIIGKNIENIEINSFVKQKFIEAIDDIKIDNKMKEFEFHLSNNNSMFWYHAKLTPRKNINGNFDGVTVVIRNITERTKALMSLSDSEKKFRLIFEKSPIGIFYYNSDFKIINCNKKFADILRTSVDNALNSDLVLTTDKKIHPALKEPIIWGGNGFYEGEYLANHKLIYITLQTKSYHYYEGTNEFNAAFGIIEDTTEKHEAELDLIKQNEEYKKLNDIYISQNETIRAVNDALNQNNQKINRLNKQLKESETKYRSLTMQLPVGVYRTTIQDRFIFANSQLIQILGFNDYKEFIKRKPSDFYVDKSERDALQSQQFEKYKIFNVTTKLKRKDGKIIWVKDTYQAIFDDDGQIRFLDGILEDITKELELQNELVLAKEKAEESDKLKSAFLANMSHEIRTPVNGILGFAELLGDEDIDDDTRNNYISIIRESTNQLLTLISDIIDISKIEAGMFDLKNTEFDLHKMFDELLEIFKLQLKSKNKEHLLLSYKLDCKDDSCKMVSDKTRIAQVLSNLLLNAIKFTEKGEIIFGNILEDDKIIFYVKDTGIGIPDEMQNYIFDRFRQVEYKNTRKYGGTGLGLSICMGIVEVLGGKIWLNSKISQGSTFYFSIPINND